MKPFIRSKFLVFTILIIARAKYVAAIFCYDCNSAFDPRCGEEFDPFSLGVVNCSLKDPLEHIPEVESTFCRSIKMEIYGKVRVVRQCGYLTEENQKIGEASCRRQTGNGDLFVTYCTCTTDLCNTAPLRITLTYTTLLFAVSVLMFC